MRLPGRRPVAEQPLAVEDDTSSASPDAAGSLPAPEAAAEGPSESQDAAGEDADASDSKSRSEVLLDDLERQRLRLHQLRELGRSHQLACADAKSVYTRVLAAAKQSYNQTVQAAAAAYADACAAADRRFDEQKAALGEIHDGA